MSTGNEKLLYERFPPCLKQFMRLYAQHQGWSLDEPYQEKFRKEWGLPSWTQMYWYLHGIRVPPKMEILRLIDMAKDVPGGLDVLLGGLLGQCQPGESRQDSSEQDWLQQVHAQSSSRRLLKQTA